MKKNLFIRQKTFFKYLFFILALFLILFFYLKPEKATSTITLALQDVYEKDKLEELTKIAQQVPVSTLRFNITNEITVDYVLSKDNFMRKKVQEYYVIVEINKGGGLLFLMDYTSPYALNISGDSLCISDYPIKKIYYLDKTLEGYLLVTPIVPRNFYYYKGTYTLKQEFAEYAFSPYFNDDLLKK